LESPKPFELPGRTPLFADTELVAQGRCRCVIFTPEDDGHRAIARHVADRLRSLSGTDVPVTNAAQPDAVNVIALGQMINNPLIEKLYWNRYALVDSLCPGPGGWMVQTIHNPYPWTSGKNVIVLGGSNAVGVDAAAEAFLGSLSTGPDLRVPYTLRAYLPEPDARASDYVVLGKNYSAVTLPSHDLTEDQAQELLRTAPAESLVAFQEHSARYLVTGEEAYLQAARNVLVRMCEIYERDPGRTMTWPEETNSRHIFAMWDAVEESPVFSDDDRARFSGMLLRFLRALVGKTSDYGTLDANDTIVWNHTTFPLMGLYWGGRYFRRYYGMEDMDEYLTKADGAFRGQEKSWKPQCDADGYLTLTIGHTIEYALAEGRMHFFESGNIRTYADYLIGICDNRGWAAGFGDSSLHRSNQIPLAGVPYAFWYTRDPRYLAYLNGISEGRWPNPYHQTDTPETFEDHTGVRMYPLDQQVYQFTCNRPYYAEPSRPPNVPFEQAFDKVAYRSGPGALDQYFLLDGYARGKHLHYDGNALLKLSDAGEDWLVDADYLVRNTTEHNMVSVIRDGRAESQIPECAGLLCSADLPGFGFSETVVRDYNGVDWHRDIFWCKGDWIVVMDRLIAKTAAQYDFDCVWKALDKNDIELDGSGGLAVQRAVDLPGVGPDAPSAAPHTFHIVNASGASSTLRRRVGTPGPVAMLVQRQSNDLADGSQHAFQNLLYLDGPNETKDYQLHNLDEKSAVLEAPDSMILGTGRFEQDGVHISAGLYLIGEERLALCQASEIQIGKMHLKASPPISLEADMASGTASLAAELQTELVRKDESPLQIQPGFHRISLRFSDTDREAVSRIVGGAPRDTGPVRAPAQDPSPTQSGNLDELWRVEPESDPGPILSIVPWRPLDRSSDSAASTLLVCQGNKLKCYGPGPTIYWTFTTPDLVRCVTTADVDSDGQLEILCGGDDECVHLLNSSGHEIRNHHLTERLIVGQGGTVNPCVNALLATDLNGDGGVEIVAGCTNSQISMFDPQFNRIWNHGGIYHGVRKIVAADLSAGQGKEVLAADHYGSVHAIGPGGERLGNAYSELGDVAFDVGDINGDGQLEIVNGSGTGVTAAFSWELERLWEFDNYGYNTREVICWDIDQDGRAEVLIASDTGYVYALNGDGDLQWRCELGAPVTGLAATDARGQLEIAAGLANGDLIVLDALGQRTDGCAGASPIRFVRAIVSEASGDRYIVVVDEEERLRVLG
jgi:hypothetical protein